MRSGPCNWSPYLGLDLFVRLRQMFDADLELLNLLAQLVYANLVTTCVLQVLLIVLAELAILDLEVLIFLDESVVLGPSVTCLLSSCNKNLAEFTRMANVTRKIVLNCQPTVKFVIVQHLGDIMAVASFLIFMQRVLTACWSSVKGERDAWTKLLGLLKFGNLGPSSRPR